MRKTNLILPLLLAVTVAGCYSHPRPSGKEEMKTYTVATRQLPPPPVYNRLTWVHPPDFMPGEKVSAVGPTIKPAIMFDLKNVTLEQVGKILASSAKYHTFTSSSIAEQKISLRMLGTIDELGEALSRKAGIRVVVDHGMREIRLLPKVAESPKFLEAPKS